MADLNTIIKAIDFIEDNLRQPIGVSDMAQAVSYSLYYFSRSFQQKTHHTPYDYLIRRRIAEAARDLMSSNRNIIDIALKYQFNSHESFTRAFRRVMNHTPTQWRTVANKHFAPMPRLTETHLNLIPALTGAITAITLDAMHLTGIFGLLQHDVTSELYRKRFANLMVNTSGDDIYQLIHFDRQKPDMVFIGTLDKSKLDESSLLCSTKIESGCYIHCQARDDTWETKHYLSDYLLYTYLPNNNLVPNQSRIMLQYTYPEDFASRTYAIFIPVKSRFT